jgi:hypothetical protein
LINWPPDFDGKSYKIFISALLLLPSWALLLPRCQKSSKKCLEKNINKRLINEKMRHHVKEMCQVQVWMSMNVGGMQVPCLLFCVGHATVFINFVCLLFMSHDWCCGFC